MRPHLYPSNWVMTNLTDGLYRTVTCVCQARADQCAITHSVFPRINAAP